MTTTPHIYEFGPYQLDVRTRRLLRQGEAVALTPKAFDTLLALVERHDRVVDKAELMKLVWADSFVEDANLSQTIFVLRKILGEGSDGRSFIDTVPRRGYRFAAPVLVDPAAILADPEPAVVTAEPMLRARVRVIPRIAAALVLTAGIAWLGVSSARSGNSVAQIESLVVLPFGDLSDYNGQDYLADSMTDALITNLGQISGLRVISRTSAMTYKDTSKTVPQIARELNVDAVVEGTVQRSNGRVRLNLKLIQASTDRTLWAHSYESDVEHALNLNNEITRAIASRTTVTPTAQETARLAENTRVNPKVYEAYLKGRYFWNRRSEPDMRQAIEQFSEAVRLDPAYAPAYSGLADSYALYGSYGWSLSGGSPWTRALAMAERALELDGGLADAHTSRARIALNHELDWAGAGRGYRRALELNPGYANAHHWYGYYLMLSGRVNEGQAEIRRALELDPLSPIINANVGMGFYMARQYDTAIAYWRKSLEMHRNYRLLHQYIAAAYAAKGSYQEAVLELEKSDALAGTGPKDSAMRAHVYGRMGRTAEARTLLSELLSQDDASAYYVGLAYVGVGENDEAFKWLDKTLQERLGPFNELNADPLFDPLRSDHRFTALVQRLGLKDARMQNATTPNVRSKRLDVSGIVEGGDVTRAVYTAD